MAEHRWSDEEPLRNTLDELRYGANEDDPLAEEWFDSFVLVSRKYVKDLIGRTVVRSNIDVYARLTTLEELMTTQQDEIVQIVQSITDDVAAIRAEVDELKAANPALDLTALESAVGSLHQTAVDIDPSPPVVEPPVEPAPVEETPAP